jgi:hypothetical protein
MTSLSRVQRVPRTSRSRNRLFAAATGLTAVALVLGLGTALADPPVLQTPPTADASTRQVLLKPGAAVAKTARVAPRVAPHDLPAGKYFVIQTRFLRADGSELMGPKVSVVDGQTASIKNGSETPFVTRLMKTSDGETQPSIEFLDEGVSIKLKAVGDTDGLINVDATVELSRIASVATKKVAQTSRQSPRQSTQTVRAIESVSPGEKLSIPLQESRPKKPSPTTLQALTNVALGRRPPLEEPAFVTVEITVREAKTLPQDAAISPLLHPPVAATTFPARIAVPSGK